jgi:hypothetical protein
LETSDVMMFDGFAKSPKAYHRTPENFGNEPAFTGMTGVGTFYESIMFKPLKKNFGPREKMQQGVCQYGTGW